MDKLKELLAAKKRATEKLGTDEAINDAAIYDAIKGEIATIDGQIERAKEAKSRAAALAQPATAQASEEGGTEGVEGYDADIDAGVANLALSRAHSRGPATVAMAYSSNVQNHRNRFERALATVRAESGFRPDKSKHFRSFGEQLQAIMMAANSNGQARDPRLVRAPLGAGEVDPTGGGFLVQTDFAQAVFMLAHDMGELLGRVNKIPISEKSNGIKIPGVDETSRATGSRWGGVQSYWVDEGTQPAATKPKFRMIEFSLHKLMSLMYTSDELLQDSTALTSIASQAFSEEIMFMTEDGIFEGTGAGQPLGFMKSNALVTVPSQTGQKTQTIVKENLDNMWSRMWSRSRKNAVWLISQDIEPQLLQLNQAVGTGGQLVYLPPGGMSDSPYGTLYGRPLIANEYSSTLGTTGDITLVDLSQYTLVDKGGVQAATSMHVAFLTDQQVFRITYRVDGKPMWTVPLTPFKGANTRSPFVALANR